ncbi:MAG TPA: hypothetical protein VFV73_10885 [Streptosporangiaceae bacterium]|nr:hypothetical protein [Streptosporangiaceae bacterium]
MIESSDAEPEWGLCDHYLRLSDFGADEDYESEDDYDDEWDGYDDEAEVESLARLAAKIEPGRATIAQWVQAIRRVGAQRRSRARR